MSKPSSSNLRVRLTADGQPVVTQADDGGDGTSMSRIDSLLANITNLSDDELNELRDLVLEQLDTGRGDMFSVDALEELAEAATSVKNEFARRGDNVARAHQARAMVASLRDHRLPGPLVPEDARPSRWRVGGGGGTGITASGSPVRDADALANEFVDVARRLTANPLGPTTAVMPGSSRSVVAEAKDLKPLSVRLERNRTPSP